MPVERGAFTILDELSHLHLPLVTLAAAPAAALPAAGRTLTVIVKDVLPTGGGQLRWAPAGSKPVVSWDFDVEID